MKAIEMHQRALLRLLETLFAAAGIVPDGEPVAWLDRLVRNQILRVLLPLESAARRLIFARMKRMAAPSDASDDDDKPKKERTRRKRAGARKKGKRAPVFWLFDKLKWFPDFSNPNRRPPRGPGPQISFFDDRDAAREPAAEKTKRDPDDAARLCRRLQAVLRALKDIDAQALRLRRIIAARKADPKPRQTVPMRPGLAPGYRRNRTEEVDDILYECDRIANGSEPPDV